MARLRAGPAGGGGVIETGKEKAKEVGNILGYGGGGNARDTDAEDATVVDGDTDPPGHLFGRSDGARPVDGGGGGGGGGGDAPKIRERTGGPLGSGSVTTVVENDGDARQAITGRSGPSKDTATGKGDAVSITTPALGNHGFVKRLRGTEQAAENATGGEAFGDDSVENIGGEGNPAVTTVTDYADKASSDTASGNLGKAALAAGALIAGAAILGGGDS